jgi:hypothetical protein
VVLIFVCFVLFASFGFMIIYADSTQISSILQVCGLLCLFFILCVLVLISTLFFYKIRMLYVHYACVSMVATTSRFLEHIHSFFLLLFFYFLKFLCNV